MPSGFILQPSYRVQGGTPVVRLYGRLENGDAFLVEDDRFRPYFFVPAHDAQAVAERPGVAVEASELCDLHGGAVARVEVKVPADVRPLRERLERDGVRTFEADIRFPYRFLIDHGLGAAVEIEGAAEQVRPGFVRFRNPDLRPGSWRPRLRVLSIDIETSPDASEVFSIALVGDGADEVHITKSGDQLILRPCGKDWGRYFATKSRGSLPKREDLPLENRVAIR